MTLHTERRMDARPAPAQVGAIGWLRANLFKGPINSVLTAARPGLLIAGLRR